MGIVEKAYGMLEKYSLCDHCLGRQFAFLGYELDNKDRGNSLKRIIAMFGHSLMLENDPKGKEMLNTLANNGSFSIAAKILQTNEQKDKRKTCYLCEDQFAALDRITRKIIDLLHDYEYKTYLVGIRLPHRIEEREDEFKAEFGVKYGEGMRNGFSRAIGKMLFRHNEKPVDYVRPEITIVVDPFAENIDIQSRSIYIMGRYKKLERDIPQSRWLCKECRGRGCAACGKTGKKYPTSVEELIGEPLLPLSVGNEFVLHAAGREDADALMLGEGRPFILEIKNPRKRNLDMKMLTETINRSTGKKVEVSNLRRAEKEMIRKIKHLESTKKIYRATVEFDRDITDKELKMLEKTFTKTFIYQQTPLRVINRRANYTREKYIYETKAKRLAKNLIELTIECEGGLYIKELVTGDGKRTQPNISSTIDSKSISINLDVLNILIEDKLI
jgi:tRNA pseudouridine synthase 10